MSVARTATLVTDDFEYEGEEGQAPAFDLIANIRSSNLAFDLDDDTLARIGRKVIEECDLDLESRKAAGWDERNEAAVKLAMQVKEEKTFPWPGAANIKYPLITTAAIQFAARAYPAIVDGWSVVKGKVLGEPTPEKRERADRISAHMSWQLMEEMKEWEGDTDRLLHMLPVVGVMVRKTWFDPVEGRNRSKLITPDKFIVNYWAEDDLPRSTEEIAVYPHLCMERFRAGVWLEFPLEIKDDTSEKEIFLEQHRLLDLDEDGYPEPYIVTVHRETGKVVRILARYDEDGIVRSSAGEVVRIEPVEYYTKYEFIPSLDGSWYGIGFGTLLNALNETINATINQLLDAGTVANLGGGFIGSGVRLKSGINQRRPFEWTKVENTGGALRENIVPMQHAGPSTVLFSLLGMLIEAAKDITATKDILTGETQQANQPVGTTLAMIEQGLKVFTAIYKRIHRALKNELGQLYRLNAEYLDAQQYFDFQDRQEAVARDDYRLGDIDVLPVSDPNIVTDMQRMGRAQFLLAGFRGNPNVDQRELDRRVLDAAGIEEIETLMPPPKPTPPPPEVIKTLGELEIKKQQADADVANKYADAEAKTLQTILADPLLYEAVRRLVREGGQDGQGPVPGMGPQPPDAGGVPLPPEATGEPFGSMGVGSDTIPGGPVGGPVDGPAYGPV